MEDLPLTQRDSAHFGELIGGKFLVQRVVGEGGVGVVLEGRHNDLGTRVAIKIAHAGDREAFGVFLRNARAMARLKGPHTVRILEVGETPAGLPWVAMEYLKGQDLASILAERGPLSIDDALRWMMEVCEALSEAHDIGLVHRAVKPKNLLLSADGGASAIRVLDFGISLLPPLAAAGPPPPDPSDPVTQPRPRAARDLEVDDESQTGFFERGPERPTRPTGFGPHLLEAYQYLSPEQLRDGEVDARTDVWGVGACLFRLLTGAHAFGGKTTAEVSDNILNQSPIEARALRADIPNGLDGVLKQCLRRAPRNRFQSMESLAIALRGARAEARETPKVIVAMEKVAIASDDSPLTPLVPTPLVPTPPVPTPLEAKVPPAWKGVDAPATPLLRHPPSILQQLIEDSPPILRSPDASRGKAPGRGEAPRALAFGESPKRELPPPQILVSAQMPPPMAPLEGTRTVVRITEAAPSSPARSNGINLPVADSAKGPDTIQDLPTISPEGGVTRVLGGPPVPAVAQGNRASSDVFSFGAGFARPAQSEPIHRAEISWRPSAPVSLVAFAPDGGGGGQPPPYALRPPSSRAASVGFGLVLTALALGSVGLLYSSSVKWPSRTPPAESSVAASESGAPTSVAPAASSPSAAPVPSAPAAGVLAASSAPAPATSPPSAAPPPAPPPSTAAAEPAAPPPTPQSTPAPQSALPPERPPERPAERPPERPQRANPTSVTPPSTARRKPPPAPSPPSGDEPIPSIFDKRK